MMTALIPALAVLFVCGLIIKSLCYCISPTNKFIAWLYFIPTSIPTKPVSCVDKAELQRVFAMFDRNSDGFITKQELGESFKSLKLFTTDSELLSMVEKLDTNGDGLIDVDEFHVLYETMGAKKKKNMEEEEEEEEEDDDDDEEEVDDDDDEDEVDDEDLKEAFKVFDENHDGLITAEELQSVISCLGLKQGRSVEEARDMINKVDKDGDGMVNFKEFKEMMKASKPKTS